jgi:hypothetical protein
LQFVNKSESSDQANLKSPKWYRWVGDVTSSNVIESSIEKLYR